jgi:hypothetical protein
MERIVGNCQAQRDYGELEMARRARALDRMPIGENVVVVYCP